MQNWLTIKNPAVPAYGMIPFPGKGYSLTYFLDEYGNSCTKHGYGNFPFVKYPGLPVIDFTGDYSVLDFVEWNLLIEGVSLINDKDRDQRPDKIITFEKFLDRVESFGIEIIRKG